MFGGIGGFLYGFFAAMYFLPFEFKKDGKFAIRETVIFFIGLGVTFLMTLVLLVVFFAGPAPTQYWYLG